MAEKCSGCGRDEFSVDLDKMPCCGCEVCWDFCLYEEPSTCPGCGTAIEVVLKDPITKEPYVLVARNED